MPAPELRARHNLRCVGKFALAITTLVCLASVGGAMAVAAPLLVPAHWLAARSSDPWGRGMWSVLAALSAAEAAWVYGYWLGGDRSELLSRMPIAAAATVLIVFTGTLRSRSRKVAE